MPVPGFILQLREKIGHDLLWLPGTVAVVLDDAGRVLLNRRSDNGRWALIGGFLEPGEQPEDGALREVLEETGVEAKIERLVSIEAWPPAVCPNGDKVQCLAITYLCRAVGGEARVNDDESTEVGWFALDDLPALSAAHTRCLTTALSPAAT
jgi:ADP-ribose pyrophosphatase YjhB (NUDIX family)